MKYAFKITIHLDLFIMERKMVSVSCESGPLMWNCLLWFIYIISGWGRKSGVARATAATPSLAPLDMVR